MYSSQNINNDLLFSFYNDTRTVFKLNDIAMLTGDTNFESLNKRLNYYVKNNKIQNLRKGIYAKSNYNNEELACRIFVPSYISLEYVLQQSGIIFQYSSQITSVSYLSRSIEIADTVFDFRKIKNSILFNNKGIIQKDNTINIACAERAFLDMLYLNSNYEFDNVFVLNKSLLMEIAPIYNSKILNQRLRKILDYNGFK